ncbi:DUF55-domain-containing protein [Wolfiporia cocos MD-104 SS10]|uniref:DUF55-domain-containing protein n=1 Tax=Wolfiporia cocos (strain MD-104) TaxID=742152 RepID=A0A2H3JLP0_WOLCO|nr:DUF55-domain-containing protein [Wolfiporia cocos MD-104 SS10]
MSPKHWLMKAEPDSRMVKGKDVKFSVDDFESVGTTPWEGVRNAEARNLMKEMKTGDKVLFYHSNCKTPGVAAFAEVSKEAYPDYTAWDVSHPYYDPKTEQTNPKWHMVDVTFVARAPHFVPLALLRQIAAAPADAPPSGVRYIGADGVNAIKQMALVTRGRLSVQRVEEKTWSVIEMLAERGGWEDSGAATKPAKAEVDKKQKAPAANKGRRKPAKKGKEDAGDVADEDVSEEEKETAAGKSSKPARKRKADAVDPDSATLRRSTRTRKGESPL